MTTAQVTITARYAKLRALREELAALLLPGEVDLYPVLDHLDDLLSDLGIEEGV